MYNLAQRLALAPPQPLIACGHLRCLVKAEIVTMACCRAVSYSAHGT